jgi:hypothetical protein
MIMASYLMVDLDFLRDCIVAIVLTVVGVVIADMILTYHRKAKFVIETIHKGDKLGFSVSVKRRTIKDARVRCNNMDYPWENGTTSKRKDLFVGDTPSFVFPFQAKVEYVDDISSKFKDWIKKDGEDPNGILITIREISTQDVVGSYGIPLSFPKGSAQAFIYGHFDRIHFLDASIRIIGEGIEEERDYLLRVGLDTIYIPAIRDGKPVPELISYRFELKKRFVFW